MRQMGLFAISCPEAAAPSVPGLAYVPEFVDEREERELLDAIDREPWDTTWKRRRQVYGLSYGSAQAAPRLLGALPEWSLALAARVEGALGGEAANIVVNEYLPGQGIGLHHDFPGFGPTIVALSLGSAVLLDLFDPETQRKEVLDVEPRSLWILGGEARSRWMHGIAHRKSDVASGMPRPRGRRVSITFRSALRTER
jgi:alkylated DNA repair protein alkB family protein 8